MGEFVRLAQDDLLVTRLRELATAVTEGQQAVAREFTMRVPAEPNRDADLVLSAAADEIERLREQFAEARKLLKQIRDRDNSQLDEPWYSNPLPHCLRYEIDALLEKESE